MSQLVAPPMVDRPATDAATRALQLVSVASQGVNNLTKVCERLNACDNTTMHWLFLCSSVQQGHMHCKNKHKLGHKGLAPIMMWMLRAYRF